MMSHLARSSRRVAHLDQCSHGVDTIESQQRPAQTELRSQPQRKKTREKKKKSHYFDVTRRFSCIFAAAFFFIICSRLSADISRDEDADFPLPPAVLTGTSAGGDGPEELDDEELPLPPLLPLEDPAVEEPDFKAVAAAARLERFWNAVGSGFCGCTVEPIGFSGFGLLRFAARPASPMGLFGPAEEDSAGTFSSARLNG